MGNFLFCTRTLETCVCASSDKAYNMILWLCILCLPLCVAQKIQQQQQQQQINTVYKTAAPASYLQKKNSNSNNNNNISYIAAPVNPKYNGSCRKNLTFFVGFPMTTRESILKFSKYSNLMAKNGTKLLKNNPRLTLAVQKSLLKTAKYHKRASFIIYSIQ